ncbi:MAG: hypothetical protein NVSMB14_18250 [Isosphaeraceae bacterium]
MSISSTTRATVADLYREEGKAELIAGRIVNFMPVSRRHNRIAFKIARSLDDFAEAEGRGEAYTDNMGFVVPELSSGRESFSPDASYYAGPFLDDPGRFISGTPTFAIEVRSESDRGPAALRAMTAKRLDYFEAGTLVVWDVDPIAKVVTSYASTDPDHPRVFHLGETADAEPAVPGWRMDVDRIFP